MNQIVLTGARPTGNLHLGNYLGAIKPLIGLSSNYDDVRLFTATLHSFTDQDARTTIELVPDLIKDYIAAGVDPQKVTLFDQMDISREIAITTLYLSKLITVNRLTGLPTLKDKLKPGLEAGSANALLLQYPVMMSADILLQNAYFVPVGLDQQSHIEFARDIAEKFHSQFGTEVFTIPQGLIQEEMTVLALDGSGKMSKTKPNSALFLGDTKDEIAKKIRIAKTGKEGEETKEFKSLYLIGAELGDDNVKTEFENLRNSHLEGALVMKRFKQLLTDVVIGFTGQFTERRGSVSDAQVRKVLSSGAEKARASANSVLEAIEIAMIGKTFHFHSFNKIW